MVLDEVIEEGCKGSWLWMSVKHPKCMWPQYWLTLSLQLLPKVHELECKGPGLQ